MSIVQEIFDRGMQHIEEEHAEKEKEKLGNLRGGSCGLYQAGEFIGTCPRLARLRQKGIEVETLGYERKLMFQAGYTNEDSWVDTLTRGLQSGWSIKCEEDIPIVWETKSGTKVTGRPDLVLFEGDAPRVGIELKLVSSLWTARDVGFNLKPKMGHLIQAAHYSWKLDVPYELWYTSRADFAVGGTWEQNTFPKPSGMPEWMRQRVEFGEKKDRKTGKAIPTIKKLLPFMQGYELRWMDRGQLQYRPIGPGTDEWTTTLITKQGIEQFYEFVDSSTEIGPTPQNYNADGEKANWKPCDYCSLWEVCKKSKSSDSFEKWQGAIEFYLGNQ